MMFIIPLPNFFDQETLFLKTYWRFSCFNFKWLIFCWI